MTEVTRILASIEQGNAKAAEELLPLVYTELRRVAAQKMANERPGQTLQPTALVHEAWLRLTGSGNPEWSGRTHFFGAAAEAMRRILIEKARRKSAERHGAGQAKLDIDEIEVAAPAKDDELLAVNEALEKFAERDKQKGQGKPENEKPGEGKDDPKKDKEPREGKNAEPGQNGESKGKPGDKQDKNQGEAKNGGENGKPDEKRGEGKKEGQPQPGGQEKGAPKDGSAWMAGDCDLHGTRGGSYGNAVFYTHAGARALKDYDYRGHSYGFRVARSQ